MTEKHFFSESLDRLCKAASEASFSLPVTHVYNPLDYARDAVDQYFSKYGQGPKKALFLGMNPGPFGMAQTGIPFGETDAVRHWLKIDARIGKPAQEHPRRPVLGFDCSRSEVSGKRLWSLFGERFGTAENFFAEHFVWNYCPLLFSEIREVKGKNTCRNLPSDKIRADEIRELNTLCDQTLIELVHQLQPRYLIAVGTWTESIFKRLFGHNQQFKIHRILHPSPASPAANRDFAGTATKQLIEAGLWK